MVSIVVCACTYKRPAGLSKLLGGLAEQTVAAANPGEHAPPRVSVVIVDNECSDKARQICDEYSRRLPFPLTYVREPIQGISFARNACLRNLPPDCDFFAFIDDDEVPTPDWLEQLMLAQQVTGADVVQGRVVPEFDAGTPSWIANGGFFGIPQRSHGLEIQPLADHQQLDRAATNNVLVRTACVRELGLEFDPDFASSGGSDTLFFLTLHGKGCRIVFAHGAIVHDCIPPSRANFRYMFMERFRVASTVALLEAKTGHSPPRVALAGTGVNHMALGFRRILKACLSGNWQADRFATGAFRIASGMGKIAAALGFRYRHYT